MSTTGVVVASRATAARLPVTIGAPVVPMPWEMSCNSISVLDW